MKRGEIGEEKDNKAKKREEERKIRTERGRDMKKIKEREEEREN